MKSVTVILFVSTLVVLVSFMGCKKSEPMMDNNATMPADTNAADSNAVAAGEQTMCPVMGGPINKEIFTEYKGKKVYFCCSACIDTFNKDPEKYISKLPQFKK